jgi:acylphosphatase
MSESDGFDARVDVRIEGIVQGVGFRYWTRREAQRLGLSGWVANQSDGSVETVAEGPRDALEAFVARVSVGPPGASVEDVDIRWRHASGEFEGFAIRSGGHPGD